MCIVVVQSVIKIFNTGILVQFDWSVWNHVDHQKQFWSLEIRLLKLLIKLAGCFPQQLCGSLITQISASEQIVSTIGRYNICSPCINISVLGQISCLYFSCFYFLRVHQRYCAVSLSGSKFGNTLLLYSFLEMDRTDTCILMTWMI